MNVKIRNKFIEIKYRHSNGLVIFITNYWWFRILEISRYRRSNGSVLKAPQYFYTDRSKVVLLLWFLTVTCSCCLYLYVGSAIMLVTYFVNFRLPNDHLFGKELFIRFTASAFRKLRSIYIFSYFSFGFEGRMWDLIVSVPDHCLSFYFR